ncbi:MAG: 30S ribosomal protein S16 [Verrucomicrobia bacterium]|nr:30S ribosomal protein S16 [Verrucomicrobiota bacterium]
MVKLRLKRMGTKHAPFYRLVATDSRSPRDGRFIETVGTYDPKKKGVNYEIDISRVDYWLQSGAQPTETAASLIRKAKRQVSTLQQAS